MQSQERQFWPMEGNETSRQTGTTKRPRYFYQANILSHGCLSSRLIRKVSTSEWRKRSVNLENGSGPKRDDRQPNEP